MLERPNVPHTETELAMTNRSEFIRPSLLLAWQLLAIRKVWYGYLGEGKLPPLKVVQVAYLRRYELAGQPEGEVARERMHQANKAILLERLNPTFYHGE